MLDTMILRPRLAESCVDSHSSKMCTLDNRVSSRVFTSTKPYFSTNKEVERKSSSPAAGKSGRSRVPFRDDTDQECCVFDPDASPTSVTQSLLPAMTKIVITKCSISSLWNDKQIVKSKIFLKRLHNEASVIQALARGMIQRKKYQQAHIDKVEIEIQASCQKAATKMQALYRGTMFRTSFQVTKLELRLLQSDRLLKTQLEDIRKDKEHQMAVIYKEYQAKKYSMRKPAKDRKALIQKADETLTLLLKENKMLQSRNERLQKSIALCTKLKCELEQQITKFCDDRVNLNDYISTCEKENSEWGHLVDLYEGRIVKHEDLQEDISNRRICERLIAKKSRESIVAIISIVGEKSKDEELRRKVIALGETAF
jgi:hypothetical protein